MREAEKTNSLRHYEFYQEYFSGKVLDIGAGESPVIKDCQIFDLQHGDANRILEYLREDSFDTVHSSHCLEHMKNPFVVINDWWRLVKKGGYMLITVPEMECYEQGYWPSIFNGDHKWNFTIAKETDVSKNIINVNDLIDNLCEINIVKIKSTHHNYNYKYRKNGEKYNKTLYAVFRRVAYYLGKKKYISALKKIHFIMNLISLPIDQTVGDSLAQIEIIINKK